MEIRIATAKVPKFGHGDSGDTIEVVERPRGGITAIMADGQSHGRAAKRTSQLVVAKAVSLVLDGARDGAVARAVHDHLYAIRDGKVSCTLTIVSADLRSRTLVVSRNANTPVLLCRGGEVTVLDGPVEPIGVHEAMKPVIVEVPLEPDLLVVTYTDGVQAAGRNLDRQLSLQALQERIAAANPAHVQDLADSILHLALEADGHRPADDSTVLVLGISGQHSQDLVRKLAVTLPL